MPSKSQKVIASLATPVAVVVAGALVYQASYAAFTGQTRNSGNEWSTGSINLVDDDSGSARFQVANMLPGQTDTKCIKVTATATVPSTVKGYTINPISSAQGLENYVKITMDTGTGGSFASCAGFTQESTLITDQTIKTLTTVNTYEAGIGGWAVSGTETKTYRLTWRFDTTGLTQAQIDQLQGGKTGIDIQWEMRSDNP